MTQISEQPIATPESDVTEPEAAPRRSWTRRRIANVVTAVVVVLGLGVMLGVFLWPSQPAAAGITNDERAAMQAAGNAVVNLVSYSRSSFDDDYDRALASTTGKLHDDMAATKAQTLKTMKKGGFDLAAKLDETALVAAPDTDGTDVLVVVSGWTVNDAGKKSSPKIERVQMTMQKVGGSWLASNLQVPDGAYQSTSSTDARQQVVDAATSCLTTMNTYDYRSVATTKKQGMACTTGDFTDHYASSFDQVTKAAAQAKTSQTFQVTGAGVQQLGDDDAQLLVFAQIETTVAKDSPQYGVLSAVVTMHKVDGTWKVTGYRTAP